MLGDLVERRASAAPSSPAKALRVGVVARQRRSAVAMAGGDRGEWLRAAAALRAARARRKRADQRLRRHRDRRRVSRVRGSAAMQLVALGAEGRERVRQALRARRGPRAAQHRALQRRDRARDARPPRAPSRKQRMLEQREQRHRREARRARPRRRAARTRRPAVSAQRIAARSRRPRCSSAPSAASDAARQRAVRRHQRGGLAGVSTASRSATAMASASSSALAASITRDARERAARASPDRRARCRPVLGRCGRPQRLGDQRFARAAGPGQARHLVARDADARAAAPAWRTADGRTAAAATSFAVVDRRSASHDVSSRSVSSPGSTTAPCGSFAMVASSLAVAGIEPVEPAAITGPSMRREPLRSASINRSRRAAGSIAPRSCRMRRPVLARDLQEVERQLPVFVEIVRHQGVEPRPTPPAASSCRPSGVRDRRRARARPRANARSAAARRRRGFNRAAHFSTSCASSSRRSSPPAPAAIRARRVAGRRFGEDDLVLVDVAERHDARQHGGIVSSTSRNTSRASAQARRVGRNSVARRKRERVGDPESLRPACRRAARGSASAGTAPRPEW